MAVKIPEFILAGMYVRGSLKETDKGFVFSLRNTYAPATLQGFSLKVDGVEVEAGGLALRVETDTKPRPASGISPGEPYPLPVNTLLEVLVRQPVPSAPRLRLSILTREVGELSFSVKTTGDTQAGPMWPPGGPLSRLFSRPIRAEVQISGDSVIGTIRPEVYGHFVEHLERCVYGGIWSPNGQLNTDVVDLVSQMGPTVIRYPGGNFASDYHWEEGVGSPEKRPAHYDRAWHVEDPNLVGTDEFLEFCRQVGAQPCLVINDGSGTPEEAARWVGYCNGPSDSPMGKKRVANGHPEAYGVRYWGLGNEVWGEWQIGHTDAAGYTRRIMPFINAMRAVDPEIRLVAVGNDELTGDPREAAAWNTAVLEALGDQIDFISFHAYQPSEEGYRPYYDPDTLYRQVVSAPLTMEEAIGRLASRIESVCPGRGIGISFDEWNVKFPPPPGAHTMHEQEYTLRDGLYVASMLNVFHRTCRSLRMANLAMLVNVLPAVQKPQDGPARFTPLAWPFVLYRNMESVALECRVLSETFDVPALGLNIDERTGVPWLDVTATRSEAADRFVIGLVNRHPTRRMDCRVCLTGLGTAGLPRMQAVRCRRMSAPSPLSHEVNVAAAPAPVLRGDTMKIKVPAASVTVVELAKE